MTGRRLQAVLRRRIASDALLGRILAAAVEATAEPLIVGGYVRDAALGRESRDLDLVCARGTRRLVEALQRSFGRRGFRFRKREVTTWRFDVDGQELDMVDATHRGLLRDLQRRELTINAVAFDLVGERLVDPLRGLADLNAARLRLPRPGVIREDPVRALRAARFVSQFPGFRLSRALADEAATVRRGLAHASAERVRDELNRLLGAAEPHRGLRLLQHLGLVDAVLPELAPLRTCMAGRDRPDVWSHTVDAIELTTPRSRLPGARALRAPDARRLLRWALLLHDISKPETLRIDPSGRPTFHGHESLGARRADALLRRLRQPKAERNRITRLVRLHLRPSQLAEVDAPARGMRRLVRDAGGDLPLLVLHAACDARASGSPNAAARWRRLGKVLRSLLELQVQLGTEPLPRLIDGRDVMRVLGLRGGPAVGRVLEQVRERQEAGVLTNRSDALALLETLASR